VGKIRTATSLRAMFIRSHNGEELDLPARRHTSARLDLAAGIRNRCPPTNPCRPKFVRQRQRSSAPQARQGNATIHVGGRERRRRETLRRSVMTTMMPLRATSRETQAGTSGEKHADEVVRTRPADPRLRRQIGTATSMMAPVVV
jgi:hypothetical protein